MTMEKCDSQQEGSVVAGKDVDRNHFPSRLHTMLSTLENSPDGLGGVVGWQPHGRVFVIRNTDLFVEQILPKWFCRLKYTSFQRQLCLYGFRKLSKKGPAQGGYYHLSFFRGRLDLAGTIQQGKIKGKRGRRPKSDEIEPDFYQMALSEGQQPAESKAAPTPAPSLPSSARHSGSTPVPQALVEPIRAAGILWATQLEDLLFPTKEDSSPEQKEDFSPEQLSLEAIMQQPQFQGELFDASRQPETQPRLADAPWPGINIPFQQSLAVESQSHTIQQRASIAERSQQAEEMLFPHAAAAAAASSNVASLPRTAVARRLGDFFMSEVVPTWGWESFSGLEDPPSIAAALEQAPAPSLAMGTTLQDSYPQQQHQQLLPENLQLQRILEQQRLKALMNLNQKQQKNLKIQQEELEQQRLELHMRNQEQLEKLRMELQAREQQLRRPSAASAVPLPRPPQLFKPPTPSQLPGGRVVFQSQLQRQTQQQQQQQLQQQQQQQLQQQAREGTYPELFQHPNRSDRNPPY